MAISSIQNVLLTGGRNPMTLELARLLHGSGISVYLSDSIGLAFPRYSRAVEKYFCLPHAADNPERFIRILRRIVEEFHIDALIPTNEEAFYISQYPDAFIGRVRIFCDDFSKIRRLHHKYDMLQMVSGYGIKTPETHLLENAGDVNALASGSGQFVFKPVFSRFAVGTLISPSTEQLKEIAPSAKNPYVAQKLINGKERCSYSIAYHGKLTAHVVYEHPYKMGKGSGLYFVKTPDEKIKRFCQSFCADYNYSGQIGFDFIIDKNGDYYVIDANPRITSGIHFFRPEDNILDSFLGLKNEPATGSIEKNRMNGLSFLTLHGLKAPFNGGMAKFLRHLFNASEVIFKFRDPRPFFAQPLTLWEFFRLSQTHKISFREAFYFGNGWDGQWERAKQDVF